ncbi:hypothetical protein TYRP_002103 [Tyrophagus putrescentiae]|nr:hypothetical protein TYRP_002103 [Tyrophagus putrescentiae]
MLKLLISFGGKNPGIEQIQSLPKKPLKVDEIVKLGSGSSSRVTVDDHQQQQQPNVQSTYKKKKVFVSAKKAAATAEERPSLKVARAANQRTMRSMLREGDTSTYQPTYSSR